MPYFIGPGAFLGFSRKNVTIQRVQFVECQIYRMAKFIVIGWTVIRNYFFCNIIVNYKV